MIVKTGFMEIIENICDFWLTINETSVIYTLQGANWSRYFVDDRMAATAG